MGKKGLTFNKLKEKMKALMSKKNSLKK